MNFITFLYLYILLTSNTTETNQETHDASLQVTFSPSVLHKLHLSSIIQFASIGSFYPDTINDIRWMVLLQLFFFIFFTFAWKGDAYIRKDGQTDNVICRGRVRPKMDKQRIKWCFRDLKFTWYPYTYICIYETCFCTHYILQIKIKRFVCMNIFHRFEN